EERCPPRRTGSFLPQCSAEPVEELGAQVRDTDHVRGREVVTIEAECVPRPDLDHINYALCGQTVERLPDPGSGPASRGKTKHVSGRERCRGPGKHGQHVTVDRRCDHTQRMLQLHLDLRPMVTIVYLCS